MSKPVQVAKVGRRLPKDPQPLRPVFRRRVGAHRFVLVVIGALHLVALAAVLYA